jgi:cation transport ATPase
MDLETARNQLRPVGAKYRSLKASIDEVRDELHDAVIEALRAGLRPKEIVQLSGYTREHVRRIARSIGIERYF